MDKYMAIGYYEPYIYDAEDWDHAVWKASDHFGDYIVAIIKLPRGDQDG